MNSEDFEIVSYQAAVFTPDGLSGSATFITDLLTLWTELGLDGEPTVLPSGAGLPSDIPRVLLAREGHPWRCEWAPARLNLYWRRLTPNDKVPDFFGQATELAVRFIDKFGFRVGRLAALVCRYAHHDNPGLFLARHFCRERWEKAPLNRPSGFELHAHKRFVMAGELIVNSWVRNKAGRIGPKTSPQEAVVVEQDLNSLAEESERRAFTADEIRQFYAASETELDTILGHYYPAKAS